MSPLLSDAFALAERVGGAPVHLYTFARGTVMWRYTSDGLALTVAATGVSYAAAKIDHDEIQRKDESGATDIQVTLASRLAVVDAIRDGSTEPMTLAIHRYHPSAGGTPARFAYGQIGSLSLDSAAGTCELVLRTSEAAFDTDVPRALVTVQCAKSTYSAECGVKWEDFAADAAIVSVGHRTITVDSVGTKPDGYYDFGMVKLASPGRELLYIQRQVGTQLTVFNEVPASFIPTTAVQLLSGDDKSAATCRDRFGNIARFLGFPWLPAKNPLLLREGAPSPARVAWDEPFDPTGYVTPTKWGWYDGDHVVPNGDGTVNTWQDRSASGHDLSHVGNLAPDYVPPGSPPADGHDTGLIIFGQHLIGDPSLPAIGTPANTQLRGPDMSGASATGVEVLINLRAAGALAARLATDGGKYRKLWFMNGPGYGNDSDTYGDQNGVFHSTCGLGFPTSYTFGPAMADLTQECVYNISIGLDRWTARLNGTVLWTIAKEAGYPGPASALSMVFGNGVGGWFYGVARRMVIYLGTLSPSDRGLAYLYTQTGVGTPP